MIKKRADKHKVRYFNDDLEEIERWVIERRKFFIKLGFLILFVIILFIISNFLK